MVAKLGILKPVDLRAIWDNEALGFTPWLAQEQSLAILGETLGMEIELVSQEQRHLY